MHRAGRQITKGIALITGAAVGLYLVVRAVAEPFVIHMTDPASYRNDWGGPSLAGVLAVHCLPGLVVLAVFVMWVLRRHASQAAR